MTLRILMLLATVAICYLLFLRVGLGPAHSPGTDRPDAATVAVPDQYKAAMDKAHAAAQQMQAQRAEADAQ